MVFPEILYYYSSLLRGASGVATDLVASASDAGMEDRTYNRNPCIELGLVPSHDGIHSYFQ